MNFEDKQKSYPFAAIIKYENTISGSVLWF